MLKFFFCFLVLLIVFATKSYAYLSKEEKYSMVGRSLVYAVALDAAEEYCSPSSVVSDDRYNTLNTLVEYKLGIDLNKMMPKINELLGVNWVITIKETTKIMIDDFGGCDSGNYYEWLIKQEKKNSDYLFIITTFD